MSEHVSLNNSCLYSKPVRLCKCVLNCALEKLHPLCFPCLLPGDALALQGAENVGDHACVQTNQTLFIRPRHSYWAQRGFVIVPALDVLSVSWERQE